MYMKYSMEMKYRTTEINRREN